MGFLDHSTNNIIVDAVLTDIGREMLSRNDGSFKPTQFGLGDDEVDYSIIKQFGRTVGKEKIEKNTPIMEALTHSNLALKHRLLSVDNPYLTHYPAITITGLTADIITLIRNKAGQDTKTINVEFAAKTQAQIPVNLIDNTVKIEMDRRFLYIEGGTASLIGVDNISCYHITTATSSNAVEAQFTIALRTIDDVAYRTFSEATGAYIRSFVKVTGTTSGVSKTFEVRIK